MVKLAEKIEEPSSDVIGYIMVSYAVTPSLNKSILVITLGFRHVHQMEVYNDLSDVSCLPGRNMSPQGCTGAR